MKHAGRPVLLLALFAAYLSTALFGLQLDAVSGFATLVWPPTGIAIAFLVLFGRRLWPAVFLGAFFANFITGASPLLALAIAAGNALEAIVASTLLSRRGFRPELARARDVFDLAVFGAILSPIVSATIGVFSLFLAGVVTPETVVPTWTAWWTGDVLGAIVVAPVIFALASLAHPHRRRRNPSWLLEAAALLVLLCLFNILVFLGTFRSGVGFTAVAYLLQPILVWAALRFGPRATAMAVFLTASFAVGGTMIGRGPFVFGTILNENLFFLQLFIGSVAVMQLTLAAVVSERERAQHELKDLNRKLEERVSLQTAEIREAKEKNDALLENIGDGVIAIDHEAKVTVVNAAAERMIGVLRAKVVGRNFEKAFFMEDASGRTVSPPPMRISLATGKSVVTTAIDPKFYVRADGTRFPASITTTPVFLGKALIGVVQVFRDVTEEQRVERSKTEFVELASHQLRAPLTAIRWNLDLLSEDGHLDSSRRVETLKEIRAATYRMGEVIGAVLNVSKVDLGLFPIVPVAVDLERLAKDVEDELSVAIAQKRLTVAVKAKGTVESDRNLLHIVLQNLLSNSVKYSSERGQIDVSVEHKDGRLRISVADQGIGIPEAEKDQVFTKFFRTDEARRSDPEGNGLGLYLSKSILSQVGGKIWFKPNEPHGTVFHVEMPSVLSSKRHAQKFQARPAKKPRS